MSTHCKGKITQNLKLVYCLLLSFSENAESVFPSNQYIADSLGISKRAVIENTKELEKMGFISKKKRHNNSNIFTVNEWSSGCSEFTSRGAVSSLPSEASSPPSDVSSPLEVQPTALYKNRDNTTDYITYKIRDKIKDVVEETELQEDIVSNDEIENENMTSPLVTPSTVSSSLQCTNYSVQENEPIEDDPLLQCIDTVEYFSVPEFDNAIDAYQFVVSMGDSIDQNSFNRMFGRDAEYINDELAIKIKKVFL